MDYTCDNCTYRHSWDCDDGYVTHKCENFKLDMSTLSEREQELIRIVKHVFEEGGFI